LEMSPKETQERKEGLVPNVIFSNGERKKKDNGESQIKEGPQWAKK